MDKEQRRQAEVAEALRQLYWMIDEAGLSRGEISRRLNVAHPSLTRWTREKRIAPVYRRQIAKLYEQVMQEHVAPLEAVPVDTNGSQPGD